MQSTRNIANNILDRLVVEISNYWNNDYDGHIDFNRMETIMNSLLELNCPLDKEKLGFVIGVCCSKRYFDGAYLDLRFSIVKKSIAMGADVNYVLPKDLNPSRKGSNIRYRTPLYLAAENSYNEILKILLAAGANVNIPARIERKYFFSRYIEDDENSLPSNIAIAKKNYAGADLINQHAIALAKREEQALMLSEWRFLTMNILFGEKNFSIFQHADIVSVLLSNDPENDFLKVLDEFTRKLEIMSAQFVLMRIELALTEFKKCCGRPISLDSWVMSMTTSSQSIEFFRMMENIVNTNDEKKFKAEQAKQIIQKLANADSMEKGASSLLCKFHLLSNHPPTKANTKGITNYRMV